MSFLVQKFGGTSVATVDRIRNIARKVKQSVDCGHNVVVVISAMSGVTNDLISLAKQLNVDEGNQEYDSIISSGEQISSGLAALALSEVGVKAMSFQSWQIPFVTDDNFGQAEILSIGTEKLMNCLENGIVPVVSGFQGVTKDGRMTTLGRGGSDLTAVAISAALKADVCETYKDVDGVYTADPSVVPRARRLKTIHYNEMLEMSTHGAKVLQARAVEYASKHGVIVRVASSFIETDGTLVGPFQTKTTDSSVCGIALSRDLAQIDLSSVVENDFNVCEEAAVALEKNYIRADISSEFPTKLMLSKKDLRDAIQILNSFPMFVEKFFHGVSEIPMARISVIGAVDDASIVRKSLESMNVKICCFSCSDSRVNIIVSNEDANRTVEFLHTKYGLDRAS